MKNNRNHSSYLLTLVHIFCGLFFLCSRPELEAQAPGRGRPGLDQSSDQQSNSIVEEKDTLPILFFFKKFPNQVLNYEDTLIGIRFMQYDPARKQSEDWIHLGNLGSAARPVLFSPQRETGLDLGQHSYDLYKKSFDNIRLFQLNTPITQLFFSQGPGQQNSMIEALFSRNFAKGLHANIDYRRINHEGIYIHQKNRHTALTTTLWFQHPRQKFDIYLSYLYNKIEAEDNGGIKTLESLISTEDNPATSGNRGVVDVFRNQSMTRHRENGIELMLNYYLDKVPADSSFTIAKTQWIESSISYTSNDFLYYDRSSDTSYYHNFSIDERGLRSSMSLKTFSVDLSYSWRLDDSLYFRPLLTVGLNYDRHELVQDLQSSNIDNLYLFGGFNKKLWPGGEIRAGMKSYFAANVGDLELHGKVLQSIRRNVLIGELSIKRFSPNQIEKQLILNNEDFWINDYKSPSYLLWSGTWLNPGTNWKIGFQNYILNNWIYFDATRLPQQLENTEIVLSVFAEKYFRFGRWTTYHHLLYQESSNQAIPIPKLYVKSSLLLSTSIFQRALLFQPGLDFRWNTSYPLPGYFPLTGQFYNQSQYELGNIPLLDVFINFKVSSFRAFVKMENITSFFSEDVYFQHALYPYFEAALRFGINWQLRN